MLHPRSPEHTPDREAPSEAPALRARLAAFRERGAYDLTPATPEELRQLADVFRAHAEELSEEERVELLEQFLQHRVMDQREVITHLTPIAPEHRAALIEFVGNTIPPEECAVLFQTYFHNLPAYHANAFIKRFTRDEPTSAILVAPFTDLSRHFPDASVKDPKPEHDSILAKEFGTLDRVQLLITTCLESATLSGRAFPSALFQHFAKHNTPAMLPYLPELLARGDCSRREFDACVAQLTDSSGSRGAYTRVLGQFGMTAAERAEWKRIEDALGANLKRRGKEPHDPQFSATYQDAFGPFREQLDALQDRAYVRVTEHLVRTWPALRPHLTDVQVRQLIIGFSDYGIPFIRQAPALGLTVEDMKSIMVLAEERGADLFWLSDVSDIVACCEAGFAREAARHLARIIVEEGEHHYTVQRLVRHLDTVLPRFSSADQEKIVALINARCPAVWLQNLPYLLEHAPMELPAFVRAVSGDTWTLLAHYPALQYLHHRAAERGIPGMAAPEAFAASAHDRLAADPRLLASARSTHLGAIVPPAERTRILRDALAVHPDPEVIIGILHDRGRDAETAHTLLPVVRRILLEHPELFVAVAEEATAFTFTDALTFSDLVACVRRALGATDHLTQIIGDSDFVQRMLSAPNAMRDAFLRDLLARGSDAEISEFIVDLRHFRTGAKQPSAYSSFTIEEQRAMGRKAAATITAMHGAIRERCARDPSAVFTTRAYRLQEFAEFARAHVVAYCLRYPSEFADIAFFAPELIRDPENLHAFLEHAPLFAFAAPMHRLRDGLKQLPELREAMSRANPLFAIECGGALAEGYYAAVLAALRPHPLSAHASVRLEAIAVEQERIHGVQRNPMDIISQSEFETAAKQLFLVIQVPWAVQHTDALLALPARERAELFAFCELVPRAAIALDTATDVVSARAALVQAATAQLRMQFDLPSDARIAWGALSTAALRDLAAYAATHRSPRALQAPRTCIERMLGEHFTAWRAWGTEHEPTPAEQPARLAALRDEGLLPRGLTLDQYRAWLDETSASFSEVLELAMPDMHRGVRSILAQAVADHHLAEGAFVNDPRIAAEELRIATAPLTAANERLKALRAKMASPKKYRPGSGELTPKEDAEYAECSREARERFAEQGPMIEAAKARWCLLALATIRGHELQERALYLEKTRVSFADAFAFIIKHFGAASPEFLADVERIRKLVTEGFASMFGGGRATKTDLKLTDRVDAERYVRIGDIPVPSCQSLHSRMRYNAGVFAYAMDPNVRVIQVEQEDGTLVARAVLRLLEDEDGKPQLFLERVYTTNAHPKVAEAIRSIALAKAKRIRCDLHSHALEGETEPGTVIDRTLTSRGSRNTVVYTDAGGGLKRNGVYVIRNAFVIR